MYCRNCNSQLSNNSIKCLKCGTLVPPEDLPFKEEKKYDFNKVRAALIILGILILIVLIAINI